MHYSYDDTLFAFQLCIAADYSVCGHWTREAGGPPKMSSTHVCSLPPTGRRRVGGQPKEPCRLFMARELLPAGSRARCPTRGTVPCHMRKEATSGPREPHVCLELKADRRASRDQGSRGRIWDKSSAWAAVWDALSPECLDLQCPPKMRGQSILETRHEDASLA